MQFVFHYDTIKTVKERTPLLVVKGEIMKNVLVYTRKVQVTCGLIEGKHVVTGGTNSWTGGIDSCIYASKEMLVYFVQDNEHDKLYSYIIDMETDEDVDGLGIELTDDNFDKILEILQK